MTKKEINNTNAVDITYLSFKKTNELLKNENGLNTIAVSKGTYGINAALLQGNKTKTLYKITSRSTTLFQVL